MYGINGNAIEDFFSCMFFYPAAVVQMDVSTEDLEPDNHSSIFKSKKKKKKNEMPMESKDPEAAIGDGVKPSGAANVPYFLTLMNHEIGNQLSQDFRLIQYKIGT